MPFIASRPPPKYSKMGDRTNRTRTRNSKSRKQSSTLGRYFLFLLSLSFFLLLITIITLHQSLEGSWLSNRHHSSNEPVNVCSLCHETAFSLWNQYETPILESSQHPDDPTYSHQDWTHYLYQHFHPSQFSTSTPASEILHHPSLPHILNLFQQHFQYHHYQTLKQPNKKDSHFLQPPPPLKVAIVGGALTEGNGCIFSKSVQPPKGSIMSNPTYCAWPYRLEQFWSQGILRSLLGNASTNKKNRRTSLGYDLIKVVNMAEGGTETALMTPLLRNWLYPPELLPEGPDIVMNAYSLSDYTVSSSKEETEEEFDEARKAKILNEMIAFVQAVEASHPCGKPPPLVIHLYDDPGNDQQEFLESLQQAWIQNHNDKRNMNTMMVINYSDMMEKAADLENDYYELHKDDPVFKEHGEDMYDDDEVKLEQLEKKDRQEEPGLVVRNTPFGMAGHVLLSWVVAYRALELLFQYCAQQKTHVVMEHASDIQAPATDESTPSCQDPSSGDTCVFGWFAGPAGTVFKPTEINQYIQPYLLYKEHWEASTDMSAGYSRKTGLVATSPHAMITFEVPNISKEVQYINLMVLKSSLPQFRGGVAQFTIVVEDSDEDVEDKEMTFAIDGSVPDGDGDADAARPMTYPVEVDLKDFKAPIGSTLRLTIELIHGQSFKILGMMFCS